MHSVLTELKKTQCELKLYWYCSHQSPPTFSYDDSQHNQHHKHGENGGGERPSVPVPPFKPRFEQRRQAEAGRGGGRATDRPIVAATCCILCVFPSRMHVVLVLCRTVRVLCL